MCRLSDLLGFHPDGKDYSTGDTFCILTGSPWAGPGRLGSLRRLTQVGKVGAPADFASRLTD